MPDSKPQSRDELPAMFLNCTKRLAVVCAEIGLRADEPAEKLLAQSRDFRRQHDALLEAADSLVTAAHPAPDGYYSTPGLMAALDRAVDRALPASRQSKKA
jgi:hypothetical protein